MTDLAVIMPPTEPPERLRAVAVAADRAGLEQLWFWEDCFQWGGISAMGAALGWTSGLRVGIGLLPVPLRNVAATAMEISMLARLFPGRVIAGIGHGVQDWMGQVGARASSPLTLLEEYTGALAALLHGERVTTSGRYVELVGVQLDWPPAVVPPLVVGAVGPRTVALAGRLGDGVILDRGEPDAVAAAMEVYRPARADAGRPGAGEVVVFARVPGRPSAAAIAAQVGALVDAGATTVALQAVDDGYDTVELAELVAGEVRSLVA